MSQLRNKTALSQHLLTLPVRRQSLARRLGLEHLEDRTLLSSTLGQVYEDGNGNGLRDPGEVGLNGIKVELASFDAVTGETTLISSAVSSSVDVDGSGVIDQETETGLYEFDGLSVGTYEVRQIVPAGLIQTYPVVEHLPRTYFVDITSESQTIGAWPDTPLTAPVDNWLDALAAGDYAFFNNGDFLFQFGAQGNAPSRVSFSGVSVVRTNAPVDTDGDTLGDTVDSEMIQLELNGTVQSDQHEQGYIGPIKMTLSMTQPSAGPITERQDNAALADSEFDVFVEIELPDAFGISTLHNEDPITFLAREIERFPAFGSTYEYRGEGPPISLLDESGVEQGQLFFATLAPTSGLDFGNFELGTITGTKFEDLDEDGVRDDGEPPLEGWTINIQNLGLELEEEGDDDHGSGSGGPPPGRGHGPGEVLTAFTDADGMYSFTDLGPGVYHVTEVVAPPWVQSLPGEPDFEYLHPLQSGETVVLDFGNYFTEGGIDYGDAPDPTYPTLAASNGASHTIVRDFRLGALVDSEADGLQDPDAVGDDEDGADDEDGVALGAAMVRGETHNFVVTATVPGDSGLLNAWVDFNADGDWNDSGEQIFIDEVLASGDHSLSFSIPASATLGKTFARFRLSSEEGLDPTGHADDGEVEDYAVTIYDADDLGTIIGQKFEDTDGDGLHDPGELGLNDWTVELIDVATGEVVATQVTAAIGADLETEAGIYRFDNVIPGVYELREIPQEGWTQTYPTVEGEPVSYIFEVNAGDMLGDYPEILADDIASILNLAMVGDQHSFWTYAQFNFVIGGGGSGSCSGGGGGGGGHEEPGAVEDEPAEGGSRMTRLSVVGETTVKRIELDDNIDTVEAEIVHLDLHGFVVREGHEGDSDEVLGPVTVSLGLFRSTGEVGPGEHDPSVTEASFDLFMEMDATALGLGVLTNTRAIEFDGEVFRLPAVGSLFSREGGGQPIQLKDEFGANQAQLISAAVYPAFGMDIGNFELGAIGGAKFEDLDFDGERDDDEPGLAGWTIVVEQILEDDSHEDDEHGGSGQGQGGEGEEDPEPLILYTVTDEFGNWSLTDLPAGTYTVSEVLQPDWVQSTPVDPDFYTVIVESGTVLEDLDFGNVSVQPSPNLIDLAVTADGFDTLMVSYEITGGSIGPFNVDVYRSVDGTVDGGDELLDTFAITNGADLTVGVHTVNFMVGTGAGEVILPGVGAVETTTDYNLLFTTGLSTAAFEGVYHVSSGAVFVHGTPSADVMSASMDDLQLVVNGETYNYTSGDISGLRVRSHDDNDRFRAAADLVHDVLMIGGSGNDFAVGGAGRDTLDGGSGLDSLSGEDGDDSITGGSENDLIYGGNDDDTISGLSGHDKIFAGFGNDSVYGGDGDDTLVGADGNDWMNAGLGNDWLYGGNGLDTLGGSDGNDIINAGLGNDSIYGGDGDDLIAALGGDDWVNAGDGNDTVYGGEGNDSLSGTDGEDYIYGGVGNDLMYGGDDNDTMFGEEGNDTLFGGLGVDLLDGGSGTNVLVP